MHKCKGAENLCIDRYERYEDRKRSEPAVIVPRDRFPPKYSVICQPTATSDARSGKHLAQDKRAVRNRNVITLTVEE